MIQTAEMSYLYHLNYIFLISVKKLLIYDPQASPPVKVGKRIAAKKAKRNHSYSRVRYIPTADGIAVHKRQLLHVAKTPSLAETPTTVEYREAQCSEVWANQQTPTNTLGAWYKHSTPQ